MSTRGHNTRNAHHVVTCDQLHDMTCLQDLIGVLLVIACVMCADDVCMCVGVVLFRCARAVGHGVCVASLGATSVHTSSFGTRDTCHSQTHTHNIYNMHYVISRPH